MRKVLGIDPGSRNCGWAVLATSEDEKSAYLLGRGLITTRGDQAESLQMIYQSFQDVIAQYHPHSAALEAIFFNFNVSSAVKVGEARGTIILALAQCGIPSASYTPQQIKKVISGNGRADKKEVQARVADLLGDHQMLKNDHVADACAVAWCHARQQQAVG